MSEDTNKAILVIVCVWAAIGMVIGLGLVSFHSGRAAERAAERAAAIQAGVARWAVDPQSGETHFEYLSPGAKP